MVLVLPPSLHHTAWYYYCCRGGASMDSFQTWMNRKSILAEVINLTNNIYLHKNLLKLTLGKMKHKCKIINKMNKKFKIKNT